MVFDAFGGELFWAWRESLRARGVTSRSGAPAPRRDSIPRK
jgi:hypothetical protein